MKPNESGYSCHVKNLANRHFLTSATVSLFLVGIRVSHFSAAWRAAHPSFAVAVPKARYQAVLVGFHAPLRQCKLLVLIAVRLFQLLNTECRQLPSAHTNSLL